MKLSKLKCIIDKAVEYAEDCDPSVEFWIEDEEVLELQDISQFSVVPDVKITLSRAIKEA